MGFRRKTSKRWESPGQKGGKQCVAVTTVSGMADMYLHGGTVDVPIVQGADLANL